MAGSLTGKCFTITDCGICTSYFPMSTTTGTMQPRSVARYVLTLTKAQIYHTCSIALSPAGELDILYHGKFGEFFDLVIVD